MTKLTTDAIFEAALEQKSFWRFDGRKDLDGVMSKMAKSLNARGFRAISRNKGGTIKPRTLRGNDVRKFLADRGWLSGAVRYSW